MDVSVSVEYIAANRWPIKRDINKTSASKPFMNAKFHAAEYQCLPQKTACVV